MIPKRLVPHFHAIRQLRNMFAHAGPVEEVDSQEVDTLKQQALLVFRWYLGQSAHGPRHSPKEVFALLADVEPKGDKGAQSRSVFISYAREDEQKVKAIHAKLVKRGHRPWMDKVDLLPGQEWELEIRRAVDSADFFLACMSKASVSKRGFVQKEMRFALDILGEIPPGRIYLIPVRLEPYEVPPTLSALQWLDLGSVESYRKLYRAIEAHEEK